MTLHLDIETFSATDLPSAGTYRYAEDPLFEILMCAWTTDGVDYHLAVGEDEVRAIPGLFTDDIVAHNAAFERVCFSALEGTGLHDSKRYVDTMAIASANGLPAKLELLAKALKVDAKDSAGTRLINTFSKLNRGSRIYPEDRPEAWEEFKAYCVQDVRVLYQVHQAMTDRRTRTEKLIYLTDQRINDRGIRVDLDLAERAIEQVDINATEMREEFTALTGVENPGSGKQVLAWFEADGYPLPNLQKETVAKHLELVTDPTQRRALEIRQGLALTASAKYAAALNMACHDGRVRGSLRYYGAHTGRWSGKGVQLQNLPSLSFTDDEGEWDQAGEEKAVDTLLSGGRVDPTTLKKLVRPMFLGPFTVADYSAIEARVLAWLASEEWALQAFKAGEDIYVAQAKRLGEGFTRKEGKVATLALGYQGAVGSLLAMGASGTEDELLTLVKAWRKANKRIVNFWYRLEDVFWSGGAVGQFVQVDKDGTDRHIILPSKRRLIYRSVKKNADGRVSFLSPRGFRQETYGGKLTENVTQATARDVLAEALVRLEKAGVPVVSHVHDEVLAETTDQGTVVSIMTKNPRWAVGLPLAAEADVMYRYGKR